MLFFWVLSYDVHQQTIVRMFSLCPACSSNTFSVSSSRPSDSDRAVWWQVKKLEFIICLWDLVTLFIIVFLLTLVVGAVFFVLTTELQNSVVQLCLTLNCPFPKCKNTALVRIYFITLCAEMYSHMNMTEEYFVIYSAVIVHWKYISAAFPSMCANTFQVFCILYIEVGSPKWQINIFSHLLLVLSCRYFWFHLPIFWVSHISASTSIQRGRMEFKLWCSQTWKM